jgi:putative FmdB family regulatory protein
MPLYEYLCTSCGSRFERIQKFSDPPVTECPSCGGRVEKQISSPAIQFKGAGWYVTDYAKSGSSGSAGDKSKTDTAGTSKTGDSTKSESTPKADAPAAKPTTTESK